ncbi:MAG TPA: ABC transporter ATP-binding protein [Chloroflexota bacterium]|nr:ABC transporter ATP-binding protein [Chloroflexota bacterium]
MAEIRIEGVWKLFGKGKVAALKDVSLTVQDREFMVLLGPSGCGKTTLLRCIAGLEYPDRGRIFIGGRDVTDEPPRRRQIAMVFQSYAVFPHLNVFENIAFGLRMQKRPADEVKRRVERAAALMQIEPYLERFPAQLSGGQRQRVAVARGLVMEPQVLLMDEPLSNLDALLRLKARAELKRLLQDVQTTTVYVTHDQVEALSMGDRIAVMQNGEIIQADVPGQVYDLPGNIFVGGFIGTPPMNFVKGKVQGANGSAAVSVGGQTLRASLPASVQTGRDLLLGIRAENVQASTEPVPDAVSARVLVVEPLGSHLLLTVDVGGESLKVNTRADFPVAPDQTVYLKLESDKIRWFDPQSGKPVAEPAAPT